MSVSPVRGHKGWFKVTDENQKENFMYNFEYPSGRNSFVYILPRNLTPKKNTPFALNVYWLKAKGKAYCGGSNTLTEAIKIANEKREEIGEMG